MSPTQPLPPKKEIGLALLKQSSVYVHLDPRRDEVVVPAWLKKQPQLVLQVGMNMPVPIPDLRFDDDGMSCTLSFNRAAFFCVVPWAAVFAMVGDDGLGMLWPDDVPDEVAKQAQGRTTDPAARKEPSKPGSALVREVARDATPRDAGRDATSKGAGESAKAKRPRKRPSLSAVPDGDELVSSALKAPAPAGRASPSPVRPVVAPAPTPRPVLGPTRKKRELPPYLRVVK